MATGCEVVYTSCSCNRVPHALDWGSNNLVCFGTCHAVAICKPQDPACVVCLLTGHKGRVNCARWIPCDQEGETELISASSDKTVRVWRQEQSSAQYSLAAELVGHTGTVTVAAAVYAPTEASDDGGSSRTLVASAGTDSTVKVWCRLSARGKFSCTQTISLKNGFAMDLKWMVLPNTAVPMLGVAGDDHHIHLYIEQQSQLVKVQSLGGHEDWVRSLDFTTLNDGSILLASCSQDCYIRIWRLSSRDPATAQAPCSISKLTITDDIKLRENVFTFTAKGCEQCYAVQVESVLQAHDNWVYSICWQQRQGSGGCRLVSASMDKTVIVWMPDPETGIWMDRVRVGDVGGNTLGLFGAVFSPDGTSIFAHGYQGALQMWTQQQDTSHWLPGVTVGGHFDSVMDISWEPTDGEFLLSLSSDQTTRLHAPWVTTEPQQRTWHELARPQIHGFDLQCISMIDSYTFVSGADEKVVRVFRLPQNFLHNFSALTGVNLQDKLKDKADLCLPDGASVPALGLSNKAVFSGDSAAGGDGGRELPESASNQYPEVYFAPLTLSAPPSEDQLLQNTLWPEIQKLYGHTTELYATASHPHGTYVATAAKAAKATDAAVILWSTAEWRQVCTLPGHALTITQLAFSPSGRYLLSVSRDRSWLLYQQSDDKTDMPYHQVAHADKTASRHSRIIWGCAWSHDDQYFVTASRDKKAVMWGFSERSTGCLGNCVPCGPAVDLREAVTAVAMAPIALAENKYLVSFGLESGLICLYSWQREGDHWTRIHTLSHSESHHLAVKRLQFRPASPGSQTIHLASCGADHCVRIYKINFTLDSST